MAVTIATRVLTTRRDYRPCAPAVWNGSIGGKKYTVRNGNETAHPRPEVEPTPDDPEIDGLKRELVEDAEDFFGRYFSAAFAVA